MAWQPFGSLAAGNQPLSLFDTLTGQIARNVIVICSAAGANAITLTPDASVAPTVSTYLTGQHFSFLAAANSSAPVTITVGGIGALKAFQKDGTTQLTSGDLLIGQEYIVGYNAALDSAAGGFFLITPQVSAANGTPGVYVNLVIKVATNTTVTVAATFVTMFDGTNTRIKAISATCDLGSNGAVNKLDTGTIASGLKDYFIWAISNGSTDGTLASLSSTAPNMPAGYTFKALLGCVKTAAGSAQLMGTWQFNDRVQYILGLAQTTVLPAAITGASGAPATPTWTAVAITGNGNLLPANAAKFVGTIVNPAGTVIVAPNNSYGVLTSTTIPPFGSNLPAGTFNWSTSFLLESSNVYYASSVANSGLYVNGWEF